MNLAKRQIDTGCFNFFWFLAPNAASDAEENPPLPANRHDRE